MTLINTVVNNNESPLQIFNITSLFTFCPANIIFAGQTFPNSEIVAKLQVGFEGYIIGEKLKPAQIEYAEKNLVEESYQGTYKFKCDNFFVVADRKNDIIIALYQKYSGLTGDQLKKIISSFMLDFGEPTAMAHDSMIYWFYDKTGKISEDSYNKGKKAGKLDQVLMVKLKTSEDISSVIAGETNSAEAYLLISSEMMLKNFLAKK